MKATIRIKSDNKIIYLEYSGVDKIVKQPWFNDDHIEVHLKQNYTGPDKKLLQQFNASCTPYVHSFYDVVSYSLILTLDDYINQVIDTATPLIGYDGKDPEGALNQCKCAIAECEMLLYQLKELHDKINCDLLDTIRNEHLCD